MKLPFRADKGGASRKASAKPAKSKPTRRADTSLRKLFMSLVLFALPLLVIPPLVVNWQAGKQIKSASAGQASLSAQMYAGNVQNWVERQIATAELIAKDVEIARLLQNGNAAAWRTKSLALGYLFPDSIRVRLLPPGLAEEDMNASPPITFAAVDMIRVAETSASQPPMEVHAAGTPQQHINLVRRVLDPSGRRIAGHIMVSFPAQGLQNMLKKTSVPGMAELQQSGSLVLASQGDADMKSGAPQGKSAIGGSRWRIAYWVPKAGIGGQSMLMSGLLVAAIAALLLLPIAMMLYKKLLAALRRDQAACLTIVKDLRELRSKPTQPVAAVAEMGDTLELMSREADKGMMSAAPKKKVFKPDQRPVDVDNIEEVESDLLFDKSALQISQANRGEGGINASIFKAYDIRGIVGETLTAEVVYQLGRALGSEAYFRGEQIVVVGRDGRVSGPELSEALINGLKSTGRDVKDIGLVPTPVLYFAAQQLGTGSGVMLTGSHNPPEYNGLKMVIAGDTLASEAIQELHKRIETGDLLTGDGTVESVDIMQDYIEKITSDVQVIRPLKVVIDCGNGAAGEAAPLLFKSLGCNVEELFCEIDGNFPNHHPDPSKPENLTALIKAVQQQGADLGFAFDGDGDRLGVVDSNGRVIWPDRLMMLFAADVLSRNPGAQIIYDVKCSKNLANAIAQSGGEPLMWKTGHSLIKAKMKETGALLAGEMSGHIFFKERWFGFDDALYAGARLLEILANDDRSADDVFAALPDSYNTPELNIAMAEGEPAVFMEKLSSSTGFENAQLTTIDGMRAEFEDGWGLVRASNTTPNLVLRFEADDELALFRIQEEFRRVMLETEPGLVLPF
jgi:phosphomannomutase/phosphoglucomutase